MSGSFMVHYSADDAPAVACGTESGGTIRIELGAGGQPLMLTRVWLTRADALRLRNALDYALAIEAVAS